MSKESAYIYNLSAFETWRRVDDSISLNRNAACLRTLPDLLRSNDPAVIRRAIAEFSDVLEWKNEDPTQTPAWRRHLRTLYRLNSAISRLEARLDLLERSGKATPARRRRTAGKNIGARTRFPERITAAVEALRQRPGQTMPQLAHALDLPLSAMPSLLVSMEQQGILLYEEPRTKSGPGEIVALYLCEPEAIL